LARLVRLRPDQARGRGLRRDVPFRHGAWLPWPAAQDAGCV